MKLGGVQQDSAAGEAPVRVVVAAADPLARAGLVTALAGMPGLRVVGEHALAEDPSAVARRVEPDAVIIDLGWDPDEVAGEQLEAWVDFGPPALLLVETEGGEFNPRGIGTAAGIVARRSSPEQLRAAVEAVVQGLWVADPQFGGPLVSPSPIPEPLTPRELEVLHLLAEGHSNRAIGQALSISEHTVKFHVTSILGKLGAESRTEAAMLGVRAGLIVL